jgi:hypothetical protein
VRGHLQDHPNQSRVKNAATKARSNSNGLGFEESAIAFRLSSALLPTVTREQSTPHPSGAPREGAVAGHPLPKGEGSLFRWLRVAQSEDLRS